MHGITKLDGWDNIVPNSFGDWINQRDPNFNKYINLGDKKDKDANVKFYIKNGKDENHVSELLMFVTGVNKVDLEVNGRKFETVLLSLTGDIDLRKIGSLTKKMNLPEELNEVGGR